MTIWIGAFSACYLAVLPMSGTIALRNISLVALCIFLLLAKLKKPSKLHLPIPVMLWAAYLLLFPFISDSTHIAALSLVGQWGRGLLAMVVGAGVASVLFKRTNGSAFYLGLVSALPIIVHLCLFSWKAWETTSIPWGYWGRESHHADLGYAAGQAVVILSAALAVSDGWYRRWAVVLIVACLLSTAFASSRAGLIFALVGGFLVFFSVYLAHGSDKRRPVLLAMIILLLAGVAFFVVAVKEDSRWTTMTLYLKAGFLGNAIKIECEGTSSIEAEIVTQYGEGDEARRILAAIQNGDAARVVLLRAGIDLALKHPLGNDGSRFAYQNLLKEHCSNPSILMAHTHNGWVDTLLALGWAGGLLYFIVLGYFFVTGYTCLRRSTKINEWAIILVAIALFWILRGAVDSVFKDHMLEMQGFVLAYAASNLWLDRFSSINLNLK